MNDDTITYTSDFEILLKDESEKAESMSILHSMASEKYSRLSVFMNIPVIVIGSVMGLLSNLNLFAEQNIMIGVLSICISIMKMFDNYFDWTKRTEGHRIHSLSYSKISKMIQIQLSLDKKYRMVAKDLLDVIQKDLQNLKESEPAIPPDIIKRYNEKYKDEPTSKPAITNGLTQVHIHQTTPLPSIEEPRVKVRFEV